MYPVDDNDDDNETFLSNKYGMLQVFRLARHVMEEPKCNMIEA